MMQLLSAFSNPSLRSSHRLALGIVAITSALALGLPAQAASVFVTFDGPFLESPHPRNWGIGPTSVQAARAASVPFYRLDPTAIGSALAPGPISILQQDLQSHDPPTDAAVSAHSEWTAESSVSLVDSFYFLIVSAIEPTVPEAAGPYAGPEVQLGIDAADGWALVQAGGLVFPALLLEGLDSQQAFSFDIRYEILRSLPLSEYMGGQAYFLPQLRLSGAGASAAIPEPATSALLGLGLVGLAARRRYAA